MSFQVSKLAAASAIAFAFASSATWAAGASPVAGSGNNQAATASVAHKAVSTFINWGSSGGAGLVPGFNNVDTATTIKCANTAGCTIGVASMVQIAPPAGTSWAICPVVDGNLISPPCPFQGSLPDVSSFVTGNGQSNFAVANGTHTVQLQVYVDQSSSLYNWQVTYTLYKP